MVDWSQFKPIDEQVAAPVDWSQFTPVDAGQQPYTATAGTADAADLFGGLLFPDKAAPAPAAQQTTPSTALDVAASAASGVDRGANETAMLPWTIARPVLAANDWAGRYIANGIAAVRGEPGFTEEQWANRDYNPVGAINAVQDRYRQHLDEVLHKPQTTTGEYARTVGEFVPGLAAGGPLTGGLRGVATRLIGDVIAPAAVSETAGQVTKGTAAEPYARMAGALGGNLASGMVGARFGTPEGIAGAAASGVAPAQFNEARNLAARSQEMGIPLTGPEAISAATGGGTRLPQALRYAESGIEGGARTAPFFAQRPEQVDNVMQALLNSVSPPSAAPSLLGPRAADLANGVIRGVEQQRTAITEPLYAAANGQRVDADAVRGIINQLDQTAQADTSGLLAGTIGDMRRSLVERPAVPGTPEIPAVPATMGLPEIPAVPGTPAVPLTPVTDVENLNRIRKHYSEQTTPTVPGQSSATKEQNRPLNVALGQVAELLDQVPAYAAANQRFAELSRSMVDPVANGPVGRLAKADTTETAANTLLPAKPLPGGQAENADAATRLMAAEAAPGAGVGPVLPETVPALARLGIEMQYNGARKAPLSGNNQHVGAKAASAIAGNPDQRANLDAVLRTLPGGGAIADRANNILDVLFATRHRLGEGSPTAGLGTLKEASKGGLGSLALSPGKWLGAARDAADSLAARRDAGALAEMFLSPNSVDLIEQAANATNAGIGGRVAPQLAEALGRLFLQTPAQMAGGR